MVSLICGVLVQKVVKSVHEIEKSDRISAL